MVKQQATPFICQGASVLVAISTTLFSISSHAAPAQERCEYPEVFGPALASPANRVGEFRVTLGTPDYSSAPSIRNHFMFSTVFGMSLRSALANQTDRRCTAIITTSLFPDLRVFLTENRPPQAPRVDPSPCIATLQDALLNLEPGHVEINRIAAQEAADRRRDTHSNPSAVVLRHALVRIYDAGTVMQALVSIEPDAFQSFDTNAFLNWLNRRHSDVRFSLHPLRFCAPSVDSASPVDTGAERLPHSSTIPSRTLEIKMTVDQAALPAALRHVVVVGEGPAVAFSRSRKTAIEKYCNQTHPGTAEGQVGPVRIRCLRTVQFNDAWTMFYCDPTDCVSQRQAEAVAKQIVAAQEIISLAQDTAWNNEVRGPYLVNVEVNTK